MRKLYIVNSGGVPSASKAIQALKDVGVMVNGNTWYSKQAVQNAVEECNLGIISANKPSYCADVEQCILVVRCESISGYLRLYAIEELGVSGKPSNYKAMCTKLESLEYRHAMKVEIYESLIEQLRREEQ